MYSHRCFYPLRLFAAVAVGSLLQGCIYDYPDPDCVEAEDGLRVVFDWQKDPTARPEGMTTYFYPDGGGGFLQFEFSPKEGHAVIAPGFYHVVCVNNDTRNILFENQDSYSTMLVTTRPARLTDGLSLHYEGSQPPRAAKEASQPVVAAPDVVWGGGTEDIDIDVAADSIVLHPGPMVCQYTVLVTGVENIESASQVSMAISGLAAGRFLASSASVDVPVTVPASMRRSAETSLRGRMLCFGRLADRQPRCLLSIYAVLRNGERKVFEYDVSEIVDNASNPLDVTINIEGLSLPEINEGSGAGLDVDVEHWDVVNIELTT